MITAAVADTSDGEDEFATEAGPVTAAERAARWGHHGGALALEGPAPLIDAVERSLFVAGVVTQRIDPADRAFVDHPGLLDAVTHLQVASGVVLLLATPTDSDELTARIHDRKLTVSDTDPSAAIAAIHQLLHQEKILFDTEGAGL